MVSLLRIEVVRALDYHSQFEEAVLSCSYQPEETFLLTDVTEISTRWRAFPADFFEISIWLLVVLRRIAIPTNDAIVTESSIIHTHFGTKASNKGEAKGRQWWRRSGNGESLCKQQRRCSTRHKFIFRKRY